MEQSVMRLHNNKNQRTNDYEEVIIFKYAVIVLAYDSIWKGKVIGGSVVVDTQTRMIEYYE